jgi:hypothetical protein
MERRIGDTSASGGKAHSHWLFRTKQEQMSQQVATIRAAGAYPRIVRSLNGKTIASYGPNFS